ncbi:hypothetical protein COOONC_12899 [Cooperia oncophora]
MPWFRSMPVVHTRRFNYQNMASRKDFTRDNAKEHLFTSVDHDSTSGATYKAFNQLIVLGSATDNESFKILLSSLWFTQYARYGALGSSGFESVFSGEVKGKDVIRFNNWFRFYELEASNQLNYHGWFTKQPGVQVSLQFEWNNWRAMQTSMLLNTSPEFEMAVYTICALNGGQCSMTINNQPVTIFANTLKQNDVLVTLVDNMRAADVDRAGPNDLKLNWGNKQVGDKKSSRDPCVAF